jgi:hypothetical protein
MGTVKKIQDLWRLRRYVAGVCVLAVLAGVLVTAQSKSYDVGVATAQVLVDTQRSQVVGASSGVTASGGVMLVTLGTQANLLADLMVEGSVKADIAHRAGLEPNQLTGISAAVTVPSASGSGPSPASVPSGPDVYAVTTQILTDTSATTALPIIEIDAYAPNAKRAMSLASAAVAGLQAFVSSEAATEQIPNADRLSIMNLGVSRATTQPAGSSPLVAVVVPLGVLLLGCALILWIQAIVRGWRTASEREGLGLTEHFEDETGWRPYEREHALPVVGRDPVVATNGASQRHVASNGDVEGTHVPANGVSRNHVSPNGVSGAHGGSGPTADHPNVSNGDASGLRPASSSRRWASR